MNKSHRFSPSCLLSCLILLNKQANDEYKDTSTNRCHQTAMTAARKYEDTHIRASCSYVCVPAFLYFQFRKEIGDNNAANLIALIQSPGEGIGAMRFINL